MYKEQNVKSKISPQSLVAFNPSFSVTTPVQTPTGYAATQLSH
jgi:hypothetical protein